MRHPWELALAWYAGGLEALALGGAAGSAVLARAADRSRWLAPVGAAGVGATLLLLPHLAGAGAVVVGWGFAGVGNGLFAPAAAAWVAQALPPSVRPRALAVRRGLMGWAGALGALAAGAVATQGGLGLGLVAVGGAFLAGAVGLAPERR